MEEEKERKEIESYVVVHNIAKRHNVGTLARSATAFGVSELILVGRRDFNSFGSHGSTSHLRFRHFHSLADAKIFLTDRDCDICGVEITESAVSVTQHPFKRNTAFLLGNEGTGLSEKECEICDFFVYIPQYGCGTASLNVTVAASIVLHHFGVPKVPYAMAFLRKHHKHRAGDGADHRRQHHEQLLLSRLALRKITHHRVPVEEHQHREDRHRDCRVDEVPRPEPVR
ncbi:hypothetical protein DM860_002463 [Cuscuta australis]|uniref:tRNA/rRNA methyltransferase SpoU type domain-containing protein n=1 Tax=Cuscuta australis TaxID=267555 RepID=A0A328CYD1_9ASTE|nr:hypothetical protein DM860_002463 [Cuscuta australis]